MWPCKRCGGVVRSLLSCFPQCGRNHPVKKDTIIKFNRVAQLRRRVTPCVHFRILYGKSQRNPPFVLCSGTHAMTSKQTAALASLLFQNTRRCQLPSNNKTGQLVDLENDPKIGIKASRAERGFSSTASITTRRCFPTVLSFALRLDQTLSGFL